MFAFLRSLGPAAEAAGLFAVAIVVGLIADLILWKIVIPISRRSRTEFDDAVVAHGRKPSRLILPLLAMHLVRPLALERLHPPATTWITDVLTIGFIAAVAWLLIALVSVIEDVLLSEHRLSQKDNLAARKLYTQVQILKRILTVVVVIVATAAALMTFEKFRQLGTGLLASAGVAGIILGFAAQRTLGNLLAGFQIAISQPIRIDDVLIVEGEWGRVEEITLTYVVLRIWDLRRLIIPISYFIEKPFQNWTRVSADLLGTVYLYLDYGVPVDEIRAELHRLLDGSEDWDRKAEGVQVTNASERTMEVRALMSSSDSGKLWNLRCMVREKLLDHVKAQHPEALPRARALLEPLDGFAEAVAGKDTLADTERP